MAEHPGYLTPKNFFDPDKPLELVPVSGSDIRISPCCERELGTLLDTEEWKYCPYCGEKILTDEGIALWGNAEPE